MASTTKIMTAIVALENGDMNDYIKVSKSFRDRDLLFGWKKMKSLL